MHRFYLITNRSFASLLLVLSLFLPAALFSQNQSAVAQWLDACRSSAVFTPVEVFTPNNQRNDLSPVVSDATTLDPDEFQIDQLLHRQPDAIAFQIPQEDGSSLTLELAKVEILAPEFEAGMIQNGEKTPVPVHRAVHYRGILRGDPASVACLSITGSGLSAMVATKDGTFQLARMEDGSSGYVFYKTANLHAASPNACYSVDESLQGDFGGEISADDRGTGCKTVTVYFECDYKFYTDEGSSVNNVTNYVTSLFNQVATLYANENVSVAISQIYVWTTPDPYTAQGDIGNLLNTFRQTRGTGFTGNLAHFLTTRSLGGGIAYVDVICFKQYAFGVSCINTSFSNVPTYSWSVEVITHELGHNLGSWHTQSCNWPNGALDNCVNPEGSCPPGPTPVNGGTIMSYCHLTGYGINFSNGFGPVPGAKIREKILAAACLGASGTAPSGLTTTNITGVSATLNWSPVAGATNYSVQYKTASSSAWINAGNTAATTLNISNLNNNTSYQWQVKTDCSGFSSTASFITTSGSGGGGACAAPTSLLSGNISSQSATLSWAAVAGASQYTVQYKTSGSATWLTAGNTLVSAYNLTGLNSGTNYNWRVKANCSDYSVVATFVTTSSGGGSGSCQAPSMLYNNAIHSTSASISWSPVAGASSYTLQLKRANSVNYVTLGTVPTTSVTISGLRPATAYNWRVKANCSYYSNSMLLVTKGNLQAPNANSALPGPYILVAEIPEMSISPNPASNSVELRLEGADFASAEVEIFGASGALIQENELNGEVNNIEVSGLAPGVYWLIPRVDGVRLSAEKLVIIR